MDHSIEFDVEFVERFVSCGEQLDAELLISYVALCCASVALVYSCTSASKVATENHAEVVSLTAFIHFSVVYPRKDFH